MADLVQWLGEQLDLDVREIADGYADTGWHARGCDSVPDVLYPDRETGACDCGVPARVLREVEADRELLAEYERLLRAHAAHKVEAARMAEAGDHDPIRIAAVRREADYLPAMLHVMGRWAKRKAAVYEDRPGFAEAIASVE